MSLEGPTCDTRKIIKAAFQLLDEIFVSGYEYKKAAIKLSKIQDQSEHQISLFGQNDTVEDLTLMKIMDKVNSREGDEMLKIAACGTNKQAWYMKQTLKSQRYVTGWTELLKI